MRHPLSVRRKSTVLIAVLIVAFLGLAGVLSFGVAAFWTLVSLTFLYRMPEGGSDVHLYTSRGTPGGFAAGGFASAGAMVASFAVMDGSCSGDGC